MNPEDILPHENSTHLCLGLRFGLWPGMALRREDATTTTHFLMRVISCRLSWAVPGDQWNRLEYLLIPARRAGESRNAYGERCVAYLRAALHLPEQATMMFSHMLT